MKMYYGMKASGESGVVFDNAGILTFYEDGKNEGEAVTRAQVVLLGECIIADAQRVADGNIAAKVCGY